MTSKVSQENCKTELWNLTSPNKSQDDDSPPSPTSLLTIINKTSINPLLTSRLKYATHPEEEGAGG